MPIMDKYLIDGHKLFWHLDRVAIWQKKRIIPPVYVEVSPVSFCNHRCVFCGIDFARDTGLQLDTKVMCERLVEMGKIGVRSIMFAGEGEALFHKDLQTLIKTAKDAGIDVSITTNGSRGDYDFWKEILPSLTWVRFSVDAGTAGVYAKVHNVPEKSFGKTIKRIEDAVKIKKDHTLGVTIGVQFLIIEENLNNIEDALRLFNDLGVDYLSLKPYSLHPQMMNKKDVVYTKETMYYVQEILNKYKKDKTKMNIIFRKDAMERYMNREKNIKHCRALPFWGYISSKGDFYTCSVFIGDERFKAGNIYNEDMQNIIFGDARKNSIKYGAEILSIGEECRLNCRMARVNEFLEFLENKPEHVNFI